jgi:chaperone required for assembly of F1-ATPase
LTALPNCPPKRRQAFAAYIMSDLLCYRAEHPDTLVQKQAENWDPLLDWTKSRFDVSLTVTAGILPVQQPEANRQRFITAAGDEPFRLTGLAHLAALLGSAILPMALDEAHIRRATAYELAFLDDLFQIDEWGADAEAIDRLDKIALDNRHASGYLSALKPAQ